MTSAVCKAGVAPLSVLGHIFASGILEEENNRTEFNQVAKAMQQYAPEVWNVYFSMGKDARINAGMVPSLPL